MPFLRSTIEFFIRKLKKDQSYKLENQYSTKQLFYISFYRLLQLIRGFFLKFRIKSKGLVFKGRNVVVEHAYLLRSGRSLILEDYVSINALSQNGIIMGDNVTIAKFSVLTSTGVIANKGIGIRIGSNSAVGAHSFLGGQGGIIIGENVIMGPNVKIFSENHNFKDLTVIIRKQGESRKGVEIKNDCWIGAGATILDGVVLESGCVVAAGSVVTKSFASNSIIAGVPAKLVKYR